MNACAHESLIGVDQTQGDGKVWECCSCGRRVRVERIGGGLVRTVEVTQ